MADPCGTAHPCRVAALHLLPETPNPDSVQARREGLSLEDPRPSLHLRQTWAGERECSSGNSGASHACTSRSRRSRVPPSPPPGHAPQHRAHTGPGPLSQQGYLGVNAAPGRAYLALDQLHHFGCCGEGATRVSAEPDGNGSEVPDGACSRTRRPPSLYRDRAERDGAERTGTRDGDALSRLPRPPRRSGRPRLDHAPERWGGFQGRS